MRAFIENEKKRLKNYLTQRTWAGFLRKSEMSRKCQKAAFHIGFEVKISFEKLWISDKIINM